MSYSGLFVETGWVPEPSKDKDLMDFYVDDVSCSYEADSGIIENGGFGSWFSPMADAGWQRELRSYRYRCSMEHTVYWQKTEWQQGMTMQNLTGKVNAGRKYKVAAKVKYTSGPDSRDFAFTFRYGDGTFKNAQIATVKKNEWTLIRRKLQDSGRCRYVRCLCIS